MIGNYINHYPDISFMALIYEVHKFLFCSKMLI